MAVLYPNLGHLSSPSDSRVAPCSAWRAAVERLSSSSERYRDTWPAHGV